MEEGRKASLTPSLTPRWLTYSGSLCLIWTRLDTPAPFLSEDNSKPEERLRQRSSQTQETPDAKDDGTLGDQTSWQGSLCPPQPLRHVGHASQWSLC